jgi:hypothetical protein
MCGTRVEAVVPHLGICGQRWNCRWKPSDDPLLAQLDHGECLGDDDASVTDLVPTNCNTCLVLMEDACGGTIPLN